MADLMIELGKPGKSKDDDMGSDDGPDDYDVYAEEMIAAVKAGDAKGLASLLRDWSGMMGPPMEDEDY